MLHATIAVSSPIIEFGRTVELRWATIAAVSASIDRDVGPVPLEGSLRVTPQESTTWTITASDGQGATTTASVTVTVNPISQPSLLPPNATDLERAMEAALRRPIDIPISKLWSSADCPHDMLPYLAWSLGVEEWDADWPDSVQREVIANAYLVHSEKGTLAGLRRMLDGMGALWNYTERPEGVPMTARVEILNSASVLAADISAAIDRVKRASLHVTTVLSANVEGDIAIAAGLGSAVVVELPNWEGLPA